MRCLISLLPYKPIETEQDYMTWNRNCDWLIIVRLMRHADACDEAALKRLNEEYEMNYTPKTTPER